jgi:hypothetical protein
VGYGILFKAKADLLVTMNESCYRLHRPRSDSLSSVLSRLREVSISFSHYNPTVTTLWCVVIRTSNKVQGDQMNHSE